MPPVKVLKVLSLFFFVASVRPARSNDGSSLVFESKKLWSAARWYVVGKFHAPNTLEWLGGSKTVLTSLNMECLNAGRTLSLRRSDETLEVLHSGNWLAVEISPSNSSENFRVVSLSPKGSGSIDCDSRVTLEYAWTAARDRLKPLIFLGPNKNKFYGQEITFVGPSEDEEGLSDIQLDMYLGYWKGNFANATAGASTSLSLAPAATVRGQWLLPFYKSIGLNLTLEQSIAALGGVAGQYALYSDWQVGAFYNFALSVGDGLEIRPAVSYHQHLADDNTNLPTVAAVNKDADYFLTGLGANFYFSRNWLVSFAVDYGMPNDMAGRGVKQSYLDASGTLGYRLTPILMILSQLGYRSYMTTGVQAETLTKAQLGLRLEL